MKKAFAGGLTAKAFQYVLGTLIIAALGLGIAGFLFMKSRLAAYASETQSLAQESQKSSEKIAYLRNMEQYLSEHTDDIERAESVVADSAKYKYQDQFITEILRFSRQSGVTVTNFQFSSGDDSDSGAAAQPATQPPAGTTAAPGAAGQPETTSAPAGLKPTSVSVTIESPVNYQNLLRFVRRIENNVTKMQIASISLSAASEGSKNRVTTNAFDIEVYLK